MIRGNTSFAFNSEQNSCILITCDMYTMEWTDELIFVDFFFIQYPLSFAPNIVCDLSKASKKILVQTTLFNVLCSWLWIIAQHWNTLCYAIIYGGGYWL
jgi:hypothetical protein